MSDPNKIPLDVRVEVCTDCGRWVDLGSCKAHGHSLATVHYEIAVEQNDPVAIRRVEDLQKHGRRLLQDAPKQ